MSRDAHLAQGARRGAGDHVGADPSRQPVRGRTPRSRQRAAPRGMERGAREHTHPSARSVHRSGRGERWRSAVTDEAHIPLGDLRAIAEVLADVLTERGLVGGEQVRPVRVLTTADVAAILGRDRRWVYAHAEELGAFRYGDGPKGRLGFDVEVIERWKRERQLATIRNRA